MVTKEISPKIILLPALITTATPKPRSTINGSIQEVVVKIRINKIKATPIIAILLIKESGKKNFEDAFLMYTERGTEL